MKLVYATTRLDVGRRVFRNARFFIGPEPGASDVIVYGDFPAIAEAYRRAGVRVEVQSGAQPLRLPENVPPIPAEVRDLAEDRTDAPKRRGRTALTGNGSGEALPPAVNNAEGSADMREHIHVPAHDEHVHQPAWNEPSRDAAGAAVG